MERCSVLGALNMDSRTFLCQLPAVAAGLSTAKSMSRSRPAHAEQSGVIGFVTATFEDKAIARQRLPSATVQTMKQKLMSTQSFRQFQIAMQRSPALFDDWLSFTSRTWVQGPIDAFFSNPQLTAMMEASKELELTVDRVIETGDSVLQQGNHVPWLAHVVKIIAGHSGIYLLIESLEEMLGPHRIARLEAITDAALTRPRAVKLMAVLAALMTPQTLEGLMTLLKACFTDERLLRLMDAAEYVISDEDCLALADLALDQLSDAVPDDGILHMIASLDAAADVSLLLQTGHELLNWLLAEPAQMGASIGAFIDEVVDMKRLEVAVSRNDEVMTLERISIMGKVLAQLSPAMKADNISAATQWMHDALTSHELQAWSAEVANNVTAADIRTWWRSFDRALSPDVVFALLHLVESLLDGGRIWALMGQPQPMLEMLLLADEEARAATCRSHCGSHSSCSSPVQNSDGGSTSSRDGWNRVPLPASEGNSNKTLAEAAAAAAAAAAVAAATAASAAPACEIGDKSCQACSGACGSPVERIFASGTTLSDPDLQELIRHYLAVCRQPRRQQQRKIANQAAQVAVAASEASDGNFNASPAASVSSLSSHWEVNGLPLRSFLDADGAETETALESAAAAASAAAAVAAAAAASNSSACRFNSAETNTRGGSISLKSADTTTSTAASSQREQQQQLRQHIVQGAVAAARAVLRPKELQQLLGLLPHLLAPQRVAVALAVMDHKLRIGEHEVALGPTCEVQNNKYNNNGSRLNPSSSATVSGAQFADSNNGSENGILSSPRTRIWLALRSKLLQPVLNRAVTAAAEVAAAPTSRQQLLHAVDTFLALLTVQEYAKAQQQQHRQDSTAPARSASIDPRDIVTQSVAAIRAAVHAAQMAVSHFNTGVLSIPELAAVAPAVARPAASRAAGADNRVAHHPLVTTHSASAVLSCALGSPHSCVQLQDSSSSYEHSSSILGKSSGRQAELMATMLGLHVALLGDTCRLWWACHTTLAMQRFTNSN